MGERYFITGVQIGIIKSFLKGHVDKLSMTKLLNDIEEDQFIGNVIKGKHEPSKSEIAILLSQRIMNKLKENNLLFDEQGINVSIRGDVRNGMSMCSLALCEKFNDMITSKKNKELKL